MSARTLSKANIMILLAMSQTNHVLLVVGGAYNKDR